MNSALGFAGSVRPVVPPGPGRLPPTSTPVRAARMLASSR